MLAALGLLPSVSAALDLDQAIRISLERNERADAADERYAAARARVASARAFFFPSLELHGDYTRHAYGSTRTESGGEVTNQSRDERTGRATLDQTILEPRAFPAYSQARLTRDAARYGAADEKRRLAFDTAEAFLATLSTEQVRDAADHRLDLARQSLADAHARADAGLVGSNDVTRAELELATAQREAVRAAGFVQAAHLQLGFLLDQEITEPLQTPEQLLAEAAGEAGDPDSLAVGAAARRPDIFAAHKSAEALHASAQEASFRALPNLGLTGEYQVANEGIYSGHDDDWSLGLGVTWQAFDGGESRAIHAERSALAAAADLGVSEDERRASLDVKTAIVALSSEQASITQAVVAVGAARKNSTETSELYRQGLASALEVVDAGVRLFEAEIDLVRARFGLALAFLNLRSAMGFDPLGHEVTP